jgi:nucleoside-diphosphate-sugar epimerase
MPHPWNNRRIETDWSDAEMKVLVTGNRGLAGTVLQAELERAGHEVVGFDSASGRDIRDASAVREAARGCRWVVHLAALLGHPEDDPDEILSVNLMGTWNVLSAAEQAGTERVVFFSSVNAQGIYQGDRAPDYLPIDDDHPCYPTSPYSISKRLAEEMCRFFTCRTSIPTVCLRPPAIYNDTIRAEIEAARRKEPSFEWSPFWEYGAFLDVRDTATAAICALTCPDPGHVTLLLCADDISSASKTSRELARQIHPDVPWRGGEEYERDPYRALLDSRRARQLLGWKPEVRWRKEPERR